MGFIPPLNLGNFQPSPATLSQWIYQIWQYLQENPIATQEQIQEFIGTFITTSPETQEMIGEGVQQYLADNPPQAPVQSVQGKTGAVQLAYNEIVPASNAVPVYKASSTPSTNTLVGQYNLGYRLFVNTATQEIFTISPAGALSLVGRGKIDGTTIDYNSEDGDTTIAEFCGTMQQIEITHTDNANTPFSTIYVASNGYLGFIYARFEATAEIASNTELTSIVSSIKPLRPVVAIAGGRASGNAPSVIPLNIQETDMGFRFTPISIIPVGQYYTVTIIIPIK